MTTISNSFRRWTAVAVRGSTLTGMIVVSGLSGCGEPVKTVSPFVPGDKVFWSLAMNHNAVNLSLTAPYDTLTLSVEPRNSRGDPLPVTAAVTFRAETPEDTSVIVYPDGRIEAKKETTLDGGVKVIATLTQNGVTHSDTTFVTVTDVASPPRLTTFRFSPAPGDSTRVAAPGFLDIRFLPLAPFLQAVDAASTPIPRLAVFYESSNPSIATVDRQTGTVQSFQPGTVFVRATATAYGITRTDSIEVVVTDPLVLMLFLGVARLENGQPEQRYTFTDVTTVIAVGGNVIWANEASDSVDILFDDPSTALQGTGLSGLLYGDTSGNIAPFGLLLPDGPNRDTHARRVRSFSARGSYRWHSTRRAVSGTVLVR